MMGLNKLLNYQGWLILVNSTLSALLTFYLCAFKVLISILDQVDKYRKHCLWDKGDVNRKSGCLVAWKKATRPKNQGGLGIELTILHCCSNFFINSTIDSTSHGTLDLEYLLLKADPSSSQKQSGFFLVEGHHVYI
jgi:hypothetical protein